MTEIRDPEFKLTGLPTDVLPICVYCDKTVLDGDPVYLWTETKQTRSALPLHRSCVVAFSARILNEFEKL